jgi:hypothetical protein
MLSKLICFMSGVISVNEIRRESLIYFTELQICFNCCQGFLIDMTHSVLQVVVTVKRSAQLALDFHVSLSSQIPYISVGSSADSYLTSASKHIFGEKVSW